jgi:hypothetical protein
VGIAKRSTHHFEMKKLVIERLPEIEEAAH